MSIHRKGQRNITVDCKMSNFHIITAQNKKLIKEEIELWGKQVQLNLNDFSATSRIIYYQTRIVPPFVFFEYKI